MPINEYDDMLKTGNINSGGNEYFDMVADGDSAQKTTLKQSMLVASKKEPDRQAKVLELSKKTKLPADIVERNFDLVSQKNVAAKTDYDKIISESPGLAKWLEKPDNAAIGQDDFEPLSKIDRGIRFVAPEKQTPVTYPSEIGNALRTGWNDLKATAWHFGSVYGLTSPEEAAQGVADANKAARDRRASAPDYMKEFNAMVDKEGGDVDKAVSSFTTTFDTIKDGHILNALKDFTVGRIKTVGEVLDLVREAVSRPKGLGYFSAENLPQSLPGIAAGFGAGSLAGGPVGAIAGMAAGTFVGTLPVEIGSWINQRFQEKGIDVTDPEQVLKAYRDPELMADVKAEAERKGVTVAAVDALFNSFAGRLIPEGRGLISKGAAKLGETAIQAVGESAGEYGSQVAATKSFDKASVSDAVMEGVGSLGHSFGEVAGGTLLHNAKKLSPVKAVQEVVVQTDKAMAAQRDAQALGEVAEAVKESKTAKRYPEAVKDLIEVANQGKEATKVYFQTDDWDNYWKSKQASPAKAAAQILGDDGKAYFEAKSQGVQLEIPISDYISKVAPTEHFDGLLESTRTSADGMTLGEANGYLKELPGIMNQIAKEASGIQDETKTEVPTPESKIAENVASQLKTAGIDQSTAETYSKVYESAFRTLGERTGVDPMELYSRYGLQIQRQDQASKASGVANEATILSQSPVPAATPNAQQSSIGFYSQVEAEIQKMDFNSIPAKDLANRIKNIPGIKQEELEFTGFNEWLATKEGKVTKEEVSQFFLENGVKVEQVVLGDTGDGEINGTDWDEPVQLDPDSDSIYEESKYYLNESDMAPEERTRLEAELKDQYENPEELKKAVDNALEDWAYKLAEESISDPDGPYAEFRVREQNSHEDIFGSDERGWYHSDAGDLGHSLAEAKIRLTGWLIENDRIEAKLSDFIKPSQIEWRHPIGKLPANKTLKKKALELYKKDKKRLEAKAKEQYPFRWDEESVKDKSKKELAERLKEDAMDVADDEVRESYNDPANKKNNVAISIRAPTTLGSITGNDIKGYVFEQNGTAFDDHSVNLKAKTIEEAKQEAIQYMIESGTISPEAKPGEPEALNKPQGPAKFKSYKLDGGENYREILLTAPGIGPEKFYHRAHFDKPNILAHVRLTDRVDGEGRKTLMIEELQSDWHQQGRERGYGESGVPNAPFKNTDAWAALAIKRIIRLAAEEGYEAVAWTPGEVHTDRWGTDSVSWAKKDDHWLVGSVEQRGGVADGTNIEEMARIRGQLLEREGEKVTSKEELHKVIAETLRRERSDRSLESLTDSVWKQMQEKESGAKMPRKEGMEFFYDNLLPKKVFPAVLKKLDKDAKVTVGTVALEDGSKDVWEVPLTPKVKEAALAGQTLFQGDPNDPRGQIRFGKSGINIDLLKNADLSTFLHETGHFYLEVLADLATTENASAQIKNDHETILKWLGVEQLPLDPGAKVNLTVEQNEKFARGFEAYLMEGKAPTAALRSAFARFRAWLVSVYKDIRRLNVDLTKEVRSVFDRLLATDQEISEAESELDFKPLSEDLKKLGLNDKQAEDYSQAISDARQAAEEKLSSKLIADVLREQKSWWTDRKAEVKAEVESEINQRPEYVALSILQKGTLPDGSTLVPEQMIGLKLSREVIVQTYGKEKLKELPRPYVYSKEGVHPDVAAELFGFSSGDQLLKAIIEAPKREDVISKITESRMKEQYGDLLNDGDLRQEAIKAVHNDKRSQLLRKELEILASENLPALKGIIRKVAKRIPPQNAVREQAQKIVKAKRVRDISPVVYQRAEMKASKEAIDAVLKGDFDLAFEAKQRELLNHELFMASTNAREEVDSIVDYMKKFTKTSARERLGKAGQDYLDQVDSIMERFDFNRGVSLSAIDKRKSLAAWVESQKELGFNPVIPEKLLNEAYRQHYKDTKFEDLENIRDTVKNIAKLASLKNKLLKASELRELDAAIDEGVASIEANSKGAKPKKIETRLPQEELLRLGAGFMGSHRKFSSLIREMDGFKDNGVMWNLLVRPINEAGNNEAVKNSEATESLQKIFSVYSPSEMTKFYNKTYIPAIDSSLTKMGQMAVALNWGNADNRQKLMEGRNWTEGQVKSILDLLDERDWKTVQAIWDHIDSYWAETKAMSERVTGLSPLKVEAVPVETKYGVFNGGYYPLKYDDRLAPRAYANMAKEAAENAMHGASVRSTTRHGHREARVAGVKMPVRLDFGVAFEHTAQVIHDLTHYETLIDTNRLLGSKKLQSTIIDHYGDQVYGELRDAVQDIAAGQVGSQTSFERAINWVRTGTSVAFMGWNVMTALIQPLGFTQSVSRVGAKWIGRGMAKWLGDAVTMENTVKLVHEKSALMQNRAKTQLREINEIRNSLKLRGKLSAIEDSYFWLISKGQMVVDIPTWLGAYEKAMEQDANGDEKLASDLADQAVLDSQGGGQIKDLAQIQRGGPLQKLWTNFYSFFNVTYNLTAESIGKTNFKSPTDVGRLATDLLLLYTVPAVLGVLLRGGLRGDDMDDDILAKLASEQVSYIMGTMVGLREIGSAVQGFRGYEGPAGTRFFAEFGNLVKQVEQGEADEAFWKALNKTAGIFLHYPAIQIERFAKGFTALTDGDTGNPAVILTGPPRK